MLPDKLQESRFALTAEPALHGTKAPFSSGKSGKGRLLSPRERPFIRPVKVPRAQLAE